MKIKNLYLKNFRNYREETFTFEGGLNVLYGRNAQGRHLCKGGDDASRHGGDFLFRDMDG